MLAAITLAVALQTAEVRAEASARTLTIYRDGLAFVTETYEVDLPAGRTRLVFEGVNDRIVPQTAMLRAFEGAALESNFDAGLLTPQALFESLVGEEAVLVRTNPASGQAETVPARVVSSGRGVTVETEAGVEALACSGLPEKLASPERPEDLVARPELSVEVSREAAGRASLTLAYLAEGIGWQADYVLADGGDGTAHLRGWLTFRNRTADLFGDVPAAIVAGTLNLTGETAAQPVTVPRFLAACWPQGSTAGPFPTRSTDNPYLLGFPYEGREEAMYALAEMQAAPVAAAREPGEIVVTGTRVATEERFGDYRLYRPPGPVTLAPYQTKQIAFLDVPGVEVARRYRFDLAPWTYQDETIDLTPVWSVDNAREGSLGRALPAGTMRVTGTAGGQALLLAESSLRDLAVGLPVEVTDDPTPFVHAVVATEETTRRGLGGTRTDIVVELRLGNATDAPAEVELRLSGWDGYEGFEVTGVGGARRDDDAILPTWRVRVPEEGSAVVTVRLRHGA